MTRNLSLLSLTLLATAVHALIFLATALYLIFFGKNDLAAVSWSLTFYYENASRVVAGEVPYRDFLFEYPILSFPLFLIPRLLVADLNSYKVAFVVEMLLWDAAAIYLLARHVSETEGLGQVPARLGWYTLFCASLSPLVIGRFELAPMVLAFAAARWWFAGRSALGGVTAGLGTLMKVFPGAVAALALVWEVSRLRGPNPDPSSPRPSPPGGEGESSAPSPLRAQREGSSSQAGGGAAPPWPPLRKGGKGTGGAPRFSPPDDGGTSVSPPYEGGARGGSFPARRSARPPWKQLLSLRPLRGEGGRRPGEGADPLRPIPSALLRLTRVRGTAAFLATLAVGLAIWFGLGGRRVWESLGYHAERGVEVESLYGGALFLWGTIARTDVPWVFNYKAFHVAPEWGARLATLALPVQAATLLLVVAQFWRSGMTEGLRYSAAAVLAFIITGKVLSPQYLVWLFPFLAVLNGPSGSLARRLFLLGCVTTAMLYPGPGFVLALEHQAGAIVLLNLRNVFLLWLLAVLLFGPRES